MNSIANPITDNSIIHELSLVIKEIGFLKTQHPKLNIKDLKKLGFYHQLDDILKKQ